MYIGFFNLQAKDPVNERGEEIACYTPFSSLLNHCPFSKDLIIVLGLRWNS